MGEPTRESVALFAGIERRLRSLLPAQLYASMWLDPSAAQLMQVFHHLRTLQYILQDYVPRPVAQDPPTPGRVRSRWQEGTLLFTDLAGFTALMEANAIAGSQGASRLLSILNQYFSTMLEIVSKSGGDLLEFTGDALLVQFLATHGQNDAVQAVRAGLRMQRAMSQFQSILTEQGACTLRMRVGIHTGSFLTADIGTPARMAHVLLGQTVQVAKRAEGAGQIGQVCVTQSAIARLEQSFHWESLDANHALIADDLTQAALGEYDISLAQRRGPSSLILDRSLAGLIAEIAATLDRVDPLASYLPTPVLNLLIQNAAQRQIRPAFPPVAVLFINLMGLAEAVDDATVEDVQQITACFSRVFALIHAVVEEQGGILQKVTYHSVGSDMLVYFGAMGTRWDDVQRAVATAIAVRDMVAKLPPVLAGDAIALRVRIGIAQGTVFAAEVGEPRGRREFNILGDAVNTAARLTATAAPSQILVTEAVYRLIYPDIACDFLGAIALKGKVHALSVYAIAQSNVPESP